MDFVALVVLLAVAALSIWAWSQRPAAQFIEDFSSIWGASPWGKQLLVDFSGMASLTDDIAFHLPGGSRLDAGYSQDPKSPNRLTQARK